MALSMPQSAIFDRQLPSPGIQKLIAAMNPAGKPPEIFTTRCTAAESCAIHPLVHFRETLTPEQIVTQIKGKAHGLRAAETITAVTSPAPVSATTSASATPIKHDICRILIAEDNVVNQKITLQQLKKLGFPADTAINGKEALAAHSRAPYDLIFMDGQMPEMDGFEATEKIRQGEASHGARPVKIVALTANTSAEDKARCLAVGMNDFLGKPLRIDQLRGVLTQHLNLS
jgi:CheY-like chemotaxis protein